MRTTNINIRTDEDTKDQADQIFSDLGFNMTMAINIFLKAVIREGGMPFELKLNTVKETAANAASEEGKQVSAPAE